MKCKGGVYLITNTANGKRYVGSSCEAKQRWINHQSALRKGVHHNIHLQRAYAKHGDAAFAFSILEYVEDDAFLFEREQYWLNALVPEYNILPIAGGSRGWVMSNESRAKMSQAQKGRKHTAEARANMSKAQSGRKCAPLSEAHKAKIALARKGQVHSPEAIQKMREARKGQVPSQETREKARAATLGKVWTAEERAKLSVVRRGRKQSPEHIANRVLARKRNATAESKHLYRSSHD